MWDEYDLHGSRTLLSCGGEVGGAAATPDLLILPGGGVAGGKDGLVSMDDDFIEGRPLLMDAAHDTRIVPQFDEPATTPLLTAYTYDTSNYLHEENDDDDNGDDDDDEPCSFEEILMANNISLGSTPDKDNTATYNIVSDLEDDCPDDSLTTKISNVPFPLEEEDSSKHEMPQLPMKNGSCRFNPYQPQPVQQQEKYTNRLGSPRSRRPFHRADYGRVSDLSFLSALEEDEVDESFSDMQDSESETVRDEKISNSQSPATLIQTSLSEIYL
ncbi:hypothetical protein SK128_028124 [Halocaridina rubra]|uniref:Uncharacterized protein n=1 Tax=Halocaridina rubra TaxID=373956 RepID=A0AAN8WIE5_HALRR